MGNNESICEGQVISYNAVETKRKSKRATELIDRIKVIDRLHSISPSENLYKERISLQTGFDSLTNDQKDINAQFQSFYENLYTAGAISK
ncbi:hypothetical protein F7725_005107 [Dissostichus mawsoni]|uniref:Uncharacterized protein n=1 Tax=Dissostichus mawsoni TaxID=36200 RepID=A0A7J5YQA7_DISMA|nr:hypothetical protein F7725_005107 [Dissostichus mawsoni]